MTEKDRVWIRGPYKRMEVFERFEKKYTKLDNGCWKWTAYINEAGYGYFGFESKVVYAHRFSYRHFKGEIPKDKDIKHICQNRACVNPDHLAIK